MIRFFFKNLSLIFYIFFFCKLLTWAIGPDSQLDSCDFPRGKGQTGRQREGSSASPCKRDFFFRTMIAKNNLQPDCLGLGSVSLLCYTRDKSTVFFLPLPVCTMHIFLPAWIDGGRLSSSSSSSFSLAFWHACCSIRLEAVMRVLSHLVGFVKTIDKFVQYNCGKRFLDNSCISDVLYHAKNQSWVSECSSFFLYFSYFVILMMNKYIIW